MPERDRKTVTLVLGGVRSGKSRWAQEFAAKNQRVAYVATAQAHDAEMREKIRRHQIERPRHWQTVEEPLELACAIAEHGAAFDVLLVDCLTVFVANLLEAAETDSTSMEPRIESFLETLRAAPVSMVLVSNEVGSGVVPPYPSGRRFRDFTGRTEPAGGGDRGQCGAVGGRTPIGAEGNDRSTFMIAFMVAGTESGVGKTTLPCESSAGRFARRRRAPSAGRGGAGMKRWCAVLIFSVALPACGARTIQDELGRTVQVPEHPHRIVCLMPSVVDDVYSLGAGTDVIGVPDYTKYPAEARTKRSIGLPLTPSIETHRGPSSGPGAG